MHEQIYRSWKCGKVLEFEMKKIQALEFLNLANVKEKSWNLEMKVKKKKKKKEKKCVHVILSV